MDVATNLILKSANAVTFPSHYHYLRLIPRYHQPSKLYRRYNLYHSDGQNSEFAISLLTQQPHYHLYSTNPDKVLTNWMMRPHWFLSVQRYPYLCAHLNYPKAHTRTYLCSNRHLLRLKRVSFLVQESRNLHQVSSLKPVRLYIVSSFLIFTHTRIPPTRRPQRGCSQTGSSE